MRKHQENAQCRKGESIEKKKMSYALIDLGRGSL